MDTGTILDRQDPQGHSFHRKRILPIGRFNGTKEEFDIPGFAFFITKGRKGRYRLGIGREAAYPTIMKAKRLLCSEEYATEDFIPD